MLKVLLVDDESFILQGLKVLIDWEQEGFTITGTAANGEEALAFLENHEVDLIMADIRMPAISGTELLRILREERGMDTYFIILSGYADFAYMQQAIRYQCTDYLLKPVEREQLVETLQKVLALKAGREEEQRANLKMERAYLARNLIALIGGKYDRVNLDCVTGQMRFSEVICYVEIELDEENLGEELSDEEKRICQRKLTEACTDFLKKDSDHCVFDVSGQERVYDTGFVFCDYMARETGQTQKEYLEDFAAYLKQAANLPFVVLVGKSVDHVSSIAKSYGTVRILRSCKGFHDRKEIYYYDEEIHVSKDGGVVLCKDGIDALLSAIEQNRPAQIRQAVDVLFEEMNRTNGIQGNPKNLNINYLIFQLIHLATQQDDNVNQEEILRLISEHSSHEGLIRGSKAHMARFALEYADYLAQLRKNVSRGVLSEVEREIKNNYAKNLTLKDLGEKYYVNSAYLGQLFRKKYGCSFKDYLNEVRLDEAAALLTRTDKKIIEIAEEVGYHNLDYFVNRFIRVKGCTPAKYRRQMGGA